MTFINSNSYDTTYKKQSINYQVPTKIKTSNVIANIDSPTDGQQIYTFGKNIPTRWVAGGKIASPDSGNVFTYSNDGIKWFASSGVSTITTCNTVIYNGTIWVAGGFSTSLSVGNVFAYSYDGISWTASAGITGGMTTCNGICWNGSMFVAVGGTIRLLLFLVILMMVLIG